MSQLNVGRLPGRTRRHAIAISAISPTAGQVATIQLRASGGPGWPSTSSPTRAVADGSSPGGDLTVAQTLGARDLTLILRRVTVAPGPLRIDVITHAGSPAGTLTLTIIPNSTGVAADTGTVSLGPAPGSYAKPPQRFPAFPSRSPPPRRRPPRPL